MRCVDFSVHCFGPYGLFLFVGSCVLGLVLIVFFFFFVKAGACYAIAEKLADDIKAEYGSA